MRNFFLYLAVMAGVTYLVRMLPMVLIRRKIQNRFLLSFLYYIPYAVLTVMTIPAIFYAVGSWYAAAAGFVVAVLLSLRDRSLVVVAACSCLAVFAVELLEKL